MLQVFVAIVALFNTLLQLNGLLRKRFGFFLFGIVNYL